MLSESFTQSELQHVENIVMNDPRPSTTMRRPTHTIIRQARPRKSLPTVTDYDRIQAARRRREARLQGAGPLDAELTGPQTGQGKTKTSLTQNLHSTDQEQNAVSSSSAMPARAGQVITNEAHKPPSYSHEPSQSHGAENSYPLTYHNTNVYVHGRIRAHPEWQNDCAYKNISVEQKWHLDCPFDNITHQAPSPQAAVPSGNHCKCFSTLHGITLLSKTLTHGEGVPYLYPAAPDQKCLLCAEEIGYAGSQTVTHAIPYYESAAMPDVHDERKIKTQCGTTFHIDCAVRHIKGTAGLSLGGVKCPVCEETWNVEIDMVTTVSTAVGSLAGSVADFARNWASKRMGSAINSMLPR